MPKTLRWLLAFTFLHGAWYAIIVHPWQAPDEYLHYEYMRLIDLRHTLALRAEDRSSSLQWEIAQSMWNFEHYRYRLLPTPPEQTFRSLATPLGSTVFSPQPPLFYLLSLPIYRAIASWSVLSQLYVLRIFSVLLQVTTVWFTYRLAKLAFADNRNEWMALFPAAFVAILPQYTFISASFNNDNLAPPLIALSLTLLLKGRKTNYAFSWWAISAMAGLLAIATKRTALALLPSLALALMVFAWNWTRSDGRRTKARGWVVLSSLCGFLPVSIALLVFPPRIPAPLAGFLRIGPGSLVDLAATLRSPSSLAQVHWGSFAHTTLVSLWGDFGWLTLPAPPGWLAFWQAVTALLAVGLVAGLIRHYRDPEVRRIKSIPFLVLVVSSALVFGLLLMIAQYILSPQFYPPQGRYLFPLISGMAVLGAWAWQSIWPKRHARSALIVAWLVLMAYDVTCWGFVLIPGFYS